MYVGASENIVTDSRAKRKASPGELINLTDQITTLIAPKPYVV